MRRLMRLDTMRKLVELTAEQDRVWQSLFAIAANNGATDERADREAWDGLCEQFPKLKQFDGCEP